MNRRAGLAWNSDGQSLVLRWNRESIGWVVRGRAAVHRALDAGAVGDLQWPVRQASPTYTAPFTAWASVFCTLNSRVYVAGESASNAESELYV